jgi:hypothetical protein
MTHPSIPFFTAAVTALLLYRSLLMFGAEDRMIFGSALIGAVAIFALWAISTVLRRARM